MMNGLLPIGSVVLLTGSKKRVMIVGVCQKSAADPQKVWDYTGVLFPEGYFSADKMFMFDNRQIERVYMLGYQDEEQLEFKARIEAALEEIRNN